METETEPRAQVACRIENPQIWRDFRAIAVRKGLRAGELLEKVMQAYLDEQYRQELAR